MKRNVAAILLGLGAGIAPAADIALSNGQKIVFIGDSLTFHQGYPNWSDYVHAYLALRYPTISFNMEAMARSGLAISGMLDTSAAGYQHYSRWVYARQPHYVFSMFADNGSFTKAVYKGYAQDLVDNYIVGRSSATPYLIGMIPQADTDGFAPKCTDYDDANQEISTAGSGFPVYKTATNLLSTWTTYQAMTANSGTDLLTAPAHGFTDGTRVLFQGGVAPGGLTAETYYYVRDVTSNTFKLTSSSGGSAIDLTSNGSGTINISANWAKLRGATAADEIHPSTAASIIAAWKIITGLTWGTNVSAATINRVNGSTSTLTSETDCTNTSITSNAYDGVDFTRIDVRLPWAIDESWAGTGRDDALALYPSMAGWQKYMLKVTGLTAGTYDLFLDGVLVASVSSTVLASTDGYNMADHTTGAVWAQAQEVLGRIRDLQGISRSTLLKITSPAAVGVEKYKSNASGFYDAGHTGATLISDLATVLGELDTLNAAVRTAAQPASHTYSLRRQGSNGAVPVITITVPASPPTVTAGTPITFTAVATDSEDGTLSTAVVWTSSLDGSLGTGASINPVLSAGEHIITATIQDSDGNEAFAQITASVTTPPGASATTINATTVNITP